ncbi:hypothetical protein EST38_g10351 [Candolleomyces aberdarensis]|uniref:Inner centromere protein ARK-binding domain-containing protein n=1 Tax=Candolleomyces aberdarensis TaxID=2316362 RepID=A0A4Q2DAV7_9AGAR|nr:hypothetical protein EST38_g10351 [Candolleomyces aberdarensis]
MANDSGREFFQQQVQTQGFLFLDDYLDNILSGTKQDPLIELVKTPGRRKIVGKKPKLASKLGNPIVFSLGPLIDENAPPQETTSAKAPPVLESHSKKPEPSPPSDLKLRESRSILSDIQTPLNPVAEAPSSLATPQIETPVSLNDHLSPAHLEQANLSVIAEDDEPAERSRASIRPTVLSPEPPLPKAPSPRPTLEPSLPTAVPVAITEETKADASEEDDNDSEDGTPERDASFHSVPINSPSDYHSAQATPLSPTFPAKVTDTAENDSRQASPEPEEDDMDIETSPPPETEPTDTGHTMAPLDFTEVMDMRVPLRDADSSNKTVSLAIPSLPEPMPLRKSIRSARDPSVGATLMGGATPGNPAGKRTSWLMKAREVKALDMTAKKAPSNVFAALPEPGRSSAPGSKRKSGDVDALGPHLNDQERKSKVAKHTDGDTPSSKSSDSETKPPSSVSPPATSTPEPQTSPGVLDRLKKTVEGLVGKTITKPNSGVSVVNAIAEAKAAAEARIAERNHHEESLLPSPQRTQPEKMDVEPKASSRPPPMTLTDLFPAEGRVKEKHKAPDRPFQFSPPRREQENQSKRESTSTTPPQSPPAPAPSSSFTIPTGPVFNKPTPVFVPPAPLPGTRPLPSPPAFKEYTFQAPPQSVYSATLGLSSPRAFTAPSAKPLSAQSTMESIQSQSQRLFDDDDDVPAWVPTTQDTEYTNTSGFETQHDQQMVCDEDDSWPMDEKLAAGVQWTFNGKEDSMTWSTLPSQSQRGGDTGHFGSEKTTSSLRNVVAPGEAKEDETTNIPGAFEFNMEQDQQDEDLVGIVSQDKELAELVLGNAKASAPVENKSFRPQSQLSMASSSSSQSQSQSQPQQGGFLNQASKLFSNAWGNGKKKQPEVKKVLGMAAAAAKKQQEEADKKAARLKEMEIRRQQAIQRKAEEEKARQMEEEQKMKDEMERRKREREEQTDKRPIIKPTPAKKEEDVQAKKKPQIIEKKPELKKTNSVSSLNKSHLKPILKPSGAKQGGSSQPIPGPSMKPVEASKLPKFAPSSSSKGKAKAPTMTEDELGQPSHFLQEQMAARAKAQIQAAKHSEQLVPSESIELPDINSEYSDSEDEDRPRTYDPPNWAQSPELKEALRQQSTINPDDIFGAVRPLRMEEIFKTRTSRFRARTSSANWTGTDRLTVQEEKEYAVRMGFK